jgi:fucose permease
VASPRGGYLASFVLVGLSMSMVGPAMPHLRDRAGVGLGAAGLLVAAGGVGYVAASLVVGHRLEHLDGHRVLRTATVLSVAATATLLGLHDLWALAAAFVAIGACGGAVDVTANTLLVWHEHPTKVASSLNALHLCFGLGAIAAPLVVAASLTTTDGLGLVVAATAAVAAATWWRLAGRPTPRRRTLAEHHAAGAPHRRRVLVLAGAFFAVYVGTEGTFGAWCTTYGQGLPMGWSAGPAVLTAAFWVGFSLGRITAIVVTRRGPIDAVLVASTAAAAVVAGILAVGDGSLALAWGATALLGFSLGPQYATMLAAADRRVGLDGKATARLVGAAGTGGLLLPAATGWALDRLGADALPALVAVAAPLALVLVLVLVADRHPLPTPGPAALVVVVVAVAGLALTSCAGGSTASTTTTSTSTTTPAITTSTTATTTSATSTTQPDLGAVDRLAVAAPDPSIPEYRRAAFLDDWDYDPATGCNTRERVLVAESIVPVTVDDRCRPTGRWRSPYDGVVTTDPHDLQIDHRVPLADAWRSGAWRWSAERRHAFAVDLTDPNTLVAVTASTNESKSDRTPDQWLPPDRAAWCGYALAWVEVKARWGLSVTPAEKATLVQVLSGC